MLLVKLNDLLLDFNYYVNLFLQGDSTFVPVRAGETTDSDDAAPRAVRFNKVAEVQFNYPTYF